ncbi:hypothetical protein HCU74_16525 [Spongiibacter sp. KMU-166]|uniref:Uncharacterized protein n=1 Tax=Spongiibacter thalassae TaxID=2721624 RepID=A0ABX1GII6_9GAMM|nr:hypothetical protein [Spongiibacter thalassae]NKI19015.1 hypothetical protein [Spongiibacter thalassae]
MVFIDEIKHALQDGLGRAEAGKYDLIDWPERSQTVLAYSSENKEVLMLLLAGKDGKALSGDEYLEVAKSINRKLGAFVSPNQRVGSLCLWGGKTQGPVHVYKFKVHNPPGFA